MNSQPRNIDEGYKMADTCAKHSFEIAKDVCRTCKNSYCEECLIYSFGTKKPPYCVTCALAAAGVRRAGAPANPRLRKKGIFGRKHLVDVPVAPEPSFDDIAIQFPAEMLGSTAPMNVTRRTVSPSLVEAVAFADASRSGASPAASDLEADIDSIDVRESATDAENSLADWAASLNEPDAPAPAVAPWPEQDTAAWPTGSDTKF